MKACLEIPPVRQLIDLPKAMPIYRSLLNGCLPTWVKFRGVYDSFEHALAHVPKGARVGYDHDQIAGIYRRYTDLAFASDYPVLYWLSQILKSGSRVFDLGGNVGVSFYAWKQYLPYSEHTEWLVCDLPSVIREGQKLAAQRNEKRLRFTSLVSDGEGFECLLTSGCLQYIEARAWDLLRPLSCLPSHVIVNRIPLHASRECVTLQNIRWMVSPYHVFRGDRFVEGMQSLGYRLVDFWSDAEHSCWIPFYPEFSVPYYSGLYFCRVA